MLLIRLMVRDRTAPKGHPKMWSLEPQSAARLILCYLTHSVSRWSAHCGIQARMRVSPQHAGPERDKQIMSSFLTRVT
jgi:hypothetical protein